MMKYHYFETLEQLSDCVVQAVSSACSPSFEKKETCASELRRTCDRFICELEDALFSDFLPPLERDNIAACAHSLSRVVDQALELMGNMPQYSDEKYNEEGMICVRLAETLKASIAMLRRIRKPNEIPDIQGYRNRLTEGRRAHHAMLQKIHAGMLPRSFAQSIILTGRLRAELSHSFDELVEIMLKNI